MPDLLPLFDTNAYKFAFKYTFGDLVIAYWDVLVCRSSFSQSVSEFVALDPNVRSDPAKTDEFASLFQITKRRTKEELPFDRDTKIQHWLHPAFSMSILKEGNDEDSDLQIYTDGSKTIQGVGAGVAIFTRGTHTRSLKYRLHDRCTNNQAEQMAILKSLLHIPKEHAPHKTVTI
jgi:hypothetical protein